MAKRSIGDRLFGNTDRESVPGCWLWKGYISNVGYGQIGVGFKLLQTHRLAYEIKKGPIPEGMFVCHSCDNRACINPAHLWPGSTQENTKDMLRKGRSAKGESHSQAKLTEAAVREMRRLYDAGGVTGTQLAESFGVTRRCAERVVSRQSWTHVA